MVPANFGQRERDRGECLRRDVCVVFSRLTSFVRERLQMFGFLHLKTQFSKLWIPVLEKAAKATLLHFVLSAVLLFFLNTPYY